MIRSWKSSANRSTSIDTKDRDNWSEAADWLHQRLLIYRRVLSQPTARQS